MKRIIPLTFLSFILSSYTLANGSPKMTDNDYRGTAGVDEKYLEKLDKAEKETSERTEVTREKMEENPRNRGMAGSFGQIDSKKEKMTKPKKKNTDQK